MLQGYDPNGFFDEMFATPTEVRRHYERFRNLFEQISPDEFARFISDDMKLQPVMLLPETHIQQMLEYYMGKNTPARQDFIIENLKVELDLLEEEKTPA